MPKFLTNTAITLSSLRIVSLLLPQLFLLCNMNMRRLPLTLTTYITTLNKLGQPTQAIRPTTCSTCSRWVHELAISHGMPTEIGWNFTLLMYNTNRPLVTPFHGFETKLDWKGDWYNFYPKHTDSDIAISSEIQSKSTRKLFIIKPTC